MRKYTKELLLLIQNDKAAATASRLRQQKLEAAQAETKRLQMLSRPVIDSSTSGQDESFGKKITAEGYMMNS